MYCGAGRMEDNAGRWHIERGKSCLGGQRLLLPEQQVHVVELVEGAVFHVVSENKDSLEVC